MDDFNRAIRLNPVDPRSEAVSWDLQRPIYFSANSTLPCRGLLSHWPSEKLRSGAKGRRRKLRHAWPDRRSSSDACTTA